MLFHLPQQVIVQHQTRAIVGRQALDERLQSYHMSSILAKLPTYRYKQLPSASVNRGVLRLVRRKTVGVFIITTNINEMAMIGLLRAQIPQFSSEET